MTDLEISDAVKSLWHAIEVYERATDADAKSKAALQVQERVEHYVLVIGSRRMRDVEHAFRAAFHEIDDARDKMADAMSKCAAAIARIANEVRP